MMETFEETLLWAVQMNNIDVVRTLLSKGYDLNLRGIFNFSYDNGETIYVAESTHGLAAAFYAIAHGYETVIDVLLEYNLNMDSCQYPHTNPLEAAVLSKDIRILKKILSYCSEVNIKNHYGKTALYVAVDEGFLEAVELLLKNGAYPDIQESDLNWSPLHRCAFHGNLDILKILLKYNANPNIITNDYDTALHIASWKNHPSIIEELLNKGSSVLSKRKDGQTALHVATTYNSYHSAFILLKYGINVIEPDEKGMTALHCIALTNNVVFAEMLIQYDADINAENVNKETPIHCASVSGVDKMFEFLISKGADPFKGDYSGTSALHNAATKGYMNIIKIILSHKFISQLSKLDVADNCGMMPLGCAITNDNVEVMQILLENGSDPKMKYRPEMDNTLLHWCCFNNSYKCLKYLLKLNVIPIDSCNNRETTPLHVATMKGYLDIVKLLIEHNADVFKTNAEKENVLHLSLMEKKIEIIKFYLSQNIHPPINDQNFHEATPLNIAAEKRCIDAIKLLLKYHADPLKCNKYGRTPLHYAAANGDTEMGKLLLQAILKKDRIKYTRAQTQEGWSALHIAAEFQYVDFAYMLIKEGSLINAVNIDGYTPLHMCAKKNNVDMFKLLLHHNANIQSKANAGTTVLHVASSCGAVDLVKLIINLDSSQLNAMEKPHNATPLISALSQGQIEASLLLIEKGAETEIETCIWRDTPLDFACHSGLYDCVEKLVKIASSPNASLDINNGNIHHEGLMRRTPLHWAAISGNVDVITELLRNGANPLVLDIYGFSAGELAEQQNKKDAASLLKWWPSLYCPQFNNINKHQYEEVKKYGLEVEIEVENVVHNSETDDEEMDDIDKIPKRFVCPISQNLMVDPVFAADGYAYERSFIQAWLAQRTCSPLTRRPLRNFDLIPASTIINEINEWKSKIELSL